MKSKKISIISCQLSIILLMVVLFNQPLKAQVTIGSQSAPDGNALLDLRQNTVDSMSTKGLLLPRVALTSTTSSSPLTAHVKGMFVYNTATANDVTPGIYYNDGTKWMTSTTAAAAAVYSATAPITLTGTAIGFTSGNIATGTSAAGATAPLTVDVTASRLVGGNSTFTVNNTAPLWNANQLSGRTVATTAPTANQALTWNSTTSAWTPATLTDNNTTYTATAPVTLTGTAFGLTSGNIGYGASSATATTPLTVDVTASRLVGGNSNFTVNNTAPLWNANQLYNRTVANTAPTSGQVLAWNSTTSAWTPAADNNTTYTATAPVTLTGTAFSVTTGTLSTNGASVATATNALTIDGTATTSAIRLVVGNSTLTVNNTAPLWNANQLQGKAIVTTVSSPNTLTLISTKN